MSDFFAFLVMLRQSYKTAWMALIQCPECAKAISSKAAKCPHCGLSLNEASGLALLPESARHTAPTIKPLSVVDRFAGSLGLIILAPLVFLIPLIGWIGAIVMVFAGLAGLFSRQDDLAVVEGDCPYCALPVRSGFGETSFQCRNCRETIVFKKGYYMTLAAAVNPDGDLPDRSVNTKSTRKYVAAMCIVLLSVAAIVVGLPNLHYRHAEPNPNPSPTAHESATVLSTSMGQQPLPAPAPAPAIDQSNPLPKQVQVKRDTTVPLSRGSITLNKGSLLTVTGEVDGKILANYGQLPVQISPDSVEEIVKNE